MAHPTDYQSYQPHPTNSLENVVTILTRNFLNAHNHWTHQELELYCLKYYGPFGLTLPLYSKILKEIIHDA